MASLSPVCDDSTSTSSSSSIGATPSVQTHDRAQNRMDSNSHVSTHQSRCHSVSSPPDDDAPTSYRDVNRKLTLPSSPRHSYTGPPTLPPTRLLPLHTPPTFAIPVSSNNLYTDNRQDVFPAIVNASASHRINTTSTSNNNVLPQPSSLESYTHSSFGTSSQYGPLNYHTTRPRTSNQVFTSTSDLAAHYGIPQFLPPAPRTTPRRSSDTSPPSPDDAFSNLCSNYLNMLSQKPSDTITEDPAVVGSVATSANDVSPVPTTQESDAVQALLQVIQASPEYQMTGMNEFLTSPFDDSPWDDMLTTPALESTSLDADILTSPILGDYTDGFESQSLFSDTPGFDFAPFPESKSPVEQPPVQTINPNFDGMYTMPSPSTPSLDPSSLYSSPRLPSEKPLLTSARRKSTATGTRKNVTPGSLVPVDAPTQPRKYATPSATSRKEVPAVFARKRARSQAFGDEDDELADEVVTLPPNPTEQQLIEAKRRQNTIAARRSRKRKLEYQRELEDALERFKEEAEAWKNQALTCQALLKSHGIDTPDFTPS